MSRGHAQSIRGCSECGRPNPSDYKMCTACRKARREWIAKRRASLRGKCCTVCRGKLAKTSENYCPAHLAEQGETKRKAYQRRRRRRECTRCGEATLRGKALCATHDAAQRAAREKSERRKLQPLKTHQNANARDVVTRT